MADVGNHRCLKRWTGAGLMLVLGAPALAETNPYSLVVSEQLVHESNVLRAALGKEQSDTIATTSLRLGLDQAFGRQRVEASGSLDLGRFRQHDELNNTGYKLNAQLDWATLENLQGELGADAAQQLYRYNLDAAQQFEGRNIERTRNAFFRARIGVVTEWTLNAGASVFNRDYSAPEFDAREQRRHALQAGVRFVPSPDLGLSGTLRRASGEYPLYSGTSGADKFDRNDLEGGLAWRATGASQFDLRLAWSKEDHSQQSARSQKYWSGTASWQWLPTGKLSVLTRLIRDSDTGAETLGSGGQTEFSDARIQTGLESAVTWQASAKIRVNASVRYDRRELDNAFSVGGSQAGVVTANDHSRTLSLGLSYTPWRSTQVGCTAADQKRTAPKETTTLTYAYENRSLSCYGQFGWF